MGRVNIGRPFADLLLMDGAYCCSMLGSSEQRPGRRGIRVHGLRDGDRRGAGDSCMLSIGLIETSAAKNVRWTAGICHRASDTTSVRGGCPTGNHEVPDNL